MWISWIHFFLCATLYFMHYSLDLIYIYICNVNVWSLDFWLKSIATCKSNFVSDDDILHSLSWHFYGNRIFCLRSVDNCFITRYQMFKLKFNSNQNVDRYEKKRSGYCIRDPCKPSIALFMILQSEWHNCATQNIAFLSVWPINYNRGHRNSPNDKDEQKQIRKKKSTELW